MRQIAVKEKRDGDFEMERWCVDLARPVFSASFYHLWLRIYSLIIRKKHGTDGGDGVTEPL